MEYVMLAEGTGDKAVFGNEVTAKCVLKVGDSTVVWETTEDDPFFFVYSESGLIDGFVEAIGMMRQGDHMKVIIPPKLGYGSKESGVIPAHAYLSFDIALLKLEDPQIWIADTLFHVFQTDGRKTALELYAKMKTDSLHYDLNERQLGVLGSKLRNDGRLSDLFEIASLRTHEFPESFGAHLNLANVYIDRGEKTQARQELERCLEIDPANPTALRKLEEL